MRKTQTFSTTLRDLFSKLFARDELLLLARRFGALQRLRDIHPADLCQALIGSGFGDETRSIASARRLYARQTGNSVEESSFYTHLNPGLALMLRELFRRALQQATPAQRTELVDAVSHAGIRDILGIDATQVLLPAAAKELLPSTNEDHGGIKVTATLSVLLQRIVKVTITDARTHDRKALKLERWLHGYLLLFDRGYSDHGLFADIEDRGGFFVTRLKESSVPTIVDIRSGLGQAHVGERLDDQRPYRGEVDVDAAFNIPKGLPRNFRVIRLQVVHDDGQGAQIVDIWLVTNLRAEHFSAEQVGILYRLRWSIEKLFHVMKSVGRLDQLHSSNSDVIHAFVYATLIGILLSQDVCLAMRRARPGCEPSPHRVAILVAAWLPDILRSVNDEQRLTKLLANFELALWREGVNPNPGRPYMVPDYMGVLPHAA